MEQLTFTANRFKGASTTTSVEQVNQQDLHQQQDVEESTTFESLQRLPLLDSIHYSLIKECEKLPELREGESILSFKAATDSIAITITSQRILVFNYKTFEKRPYPFQFEYESNVYGIIPLVSIIPNPLNPLKPDLVIIDSVTGVLHFYESIKLAPSLSVLQNRLQDKITLYNAEFLTDVQIFQDNGLLITTSQKRIIHATFKDQFSDIAINFNQIYNNRPLISFMLSKSYSVREYTNSSHIIAVRTIDLSPVSKTIIVLESSGRVAFVNHLKGSSTFILEAKYDLDLILSTSELKFLDFQFITSKKTGVFLVFDPSTNLLRNFFFDMYDLKANPILVLTSTVPSIPENEIVSNPKLFLLDDKSSVLVQNNNRLIIYNLNLNQLPSPWTEVIILNEDLQIYSLVKINFSKDIVYISTDKGLLSFNLKSSGKSSDIVTYLKDHLIQYLKFSTSSSPIIFNLKETLLPITENEKRQVIDKILDELLTDNSKAIDQNLNTSDNLAKKVEIIKKLVVYVAENYDINKDEELKIKILNICELFSLTDKFYQLIIDKNLIKPIMYILNKEGVSLDNFCQKSPENILKLISKYLDTAKDVGSEVQIKGLASLLSTLFIEAFIKLDDDIKQYLNGMGLSTVFIDHFDLIYNINDVTRMVYNLNLPEDEMIAKYGEILVELSCFLYYTTNEIVTYMESHRSTNTMDEILLKFKKLLKADKNKWIHSFIVLKKQNDIIPLVNKYKDYTSLSALLESKRETIQNLYDIQEISDIEFTNLSTDIEIEFDDYFEQYGYSFAEALFTYYIKVNKINIMLTCFEKHSDILNKFLSSDINYYSFAWINDIKFQRFNNISSKMATFLSSTSPNAIKDYKLQSSLAKLATLCSGDDKEVKAYHFKQYSSSLSLVSLQEYIKSELTKLGLFLKSYDTKQLIDDDYVKSSNFGYFPMEIQSIFEKLSNNLTLSITEIITLISLASFNVEKGDLLKGKGTGVEEIALIDSDSGVDSDEIMEEEEFIAKNITDEFKIKVYVKLFKFLQNYTQIQPTSDIFAPNSSNSYYESEKQRQVWMKLLIRRLIICPSWEKLSNHIFSLVESENIRIESNEHNFILTDGDLQIIGIFDPKAYSDYEIENDLLKNKFS